MPRQYILCTEEGSIISGDFSDEETCQSEPTPSPFLHGLLRLTAYLRFASCLSTPGWMCIGIEYRQTASSFPFYPASKSSARFYETCDLIDRATSSSLPLLLSRFLSSSPSSSSLRFRVPFFDSKSRKLLPRSFGRTREYPRCYASVRLPVRGFGLRFNYELLKEAGQLLSSNRQRS